MDVRIEAVVELQSIEMACAWLEYAVPTVQNVLAVQFPATHENILYLHRTIHHFGPGLLRLQESLHLIPLRIESVRVECRPVFWIRLFPMLASCFLLASLSRPLLGTL